MIYALSSWSQWPIQNQDSFQQSKIVAADYLAELYETYGDESPIVLSVYSGNWAAVSKYKEYGIMTPYVEEVLTRSVEYERAHGK